MIGCTDDCLALAQWRVVSQQSIELVTAGAKQREAKQSRAKKSKAGLSSRVNWRQSRALTDMAQLLQLQFVSSAS